MNKDSGQFTDEYLPEQRSHLYGSTAVYPYCPTGKVIRVHHDVLRPVGGEGMEEGNGNSASTAFLCCLTNETFTAVYSLTGRK